MTSERYDIYFSGRLTEGEVESDVRERLGGRLRIDARQLALLFAGGTVVVKRNVDLDTAAGQAVVESCGGKVYQYHTEEPLVYNKENLLNPWFVVVR